MKFGSTSTGNKEFGSQDDDIDLGPQRCYQYLNVNGKVTFNKPPPSEDDRVSIQPTTVTITGAFHMKCICELQAFLGEGNGGTIHKCSGGSYTWHFSRNRTLGSCSTKPVKEDIYTPVWIACDKEEKGLINTTISLEEFFMGGIGNIWRVVGDSGAKGCCYWSPTTGENQEIAKELEACGATTKVLPPDDKGVVWAITCFDLSDKAVLECFAKEVTGDCTSENKNIVEDALDSYLRWEFRGLDCGRLGGGF